ncbi:hypothetical protein B0H10DRAFT_1955662 [Mycena sp. CBHHK59/15]|nr:hypothetical protein B0H10DRAFT_1955662 [Mycena sp. CBHHK59/15]
MASCWTYCSTTPVDSSSDESSYLPPISPLNPLPTILPTTTMSSKVILTTIPPLFNGDKLKWNIFFDPRPFVCYNCGKEGHMWQGCPEPPKQKFNLRALCAQIDEEDASSETLQALVAKLREKGF